MVHSPLGFAVVAALAGGVLGIDRTGAFQTMASRPLVAAPVVGYLLGDAWSGVVSGAVIELLLIGDIPIGTYVPAHATAIAVCVSAVTVYFMGLSSNVATAPGLFGASGYAAVAAMLATIPANALFVGAESFVRKSNKRLFEGAVSALERGVEADIGAWNLKGLLYFFLADAATIFAVALPLLLLVEYAIGPVRMPSELAFVASLSLALLVGASFALRALKTGFSILLFAAGAVLTAVIMAVFA